MTSAGIQLYGEVLWDPLLLIDRWDNRAAAFFASFVFALTTIGTNISANSLGAGNDMTVLCPKVSLCSFRRQSLTSNSISTSDADKYCAQSLGAGRCVHGRFSPSKSSLYVTFVEPLSFIDSATGFLSFMDGYTIFLGPFAGIMVTDVSVTCRHARSRLDVNLHFVLQFYLVHKGCVDVPAMYDPSGRYRYAGGFVSFDATRYIPPHDIFVCLHRTGARSWR